ncbi:MAG: uroporphyrinogen decarboxylase family protein [Verrucomicrobiota bacterium]
MTDKQWNELLAAVHGTPLQRPPVGFIIDSPWLPNWYGINILDYFTNENLWFEANRKAIETFPDVLLLPGFWSEFGMCTEPSAFGSKCVFHKNEFPFAEKVIHEVAQIDTISEPDPATDGLLPFMLNRLASKQPQIQELGHAIRFSVSRGPLNVATFLMGTTEFLLALKTDPDKAHKLLSIITNFLKEWHHVQRQTFPSIDGIFILDDIVGFIGAEDFDEFGLPYFKELFSVDVSVKFFHNDAECEESISRYPEIGINLYNPGVFNTLQELQSFSDNRLAILGNIPARDVLAKGSPAEVSDAVGQLLAQVNGSGRLVLSCAGGMPPNVTSENIRAFVAAAQGKAGQSKLNHATPMALAAATERG